MAPLPSVQAHCFHLGAQAVLSPQILRRVGSGGVWNPRHGMPLGLICASVWLLLRLVHPVTGQEATELSRYLSRPENCRLGPQGLQQVSLTAPAGIRQSQLKVALLFLTKGDLPFEPLWNTFLAGLSDVLTGDCSGPAWQNLLGLYVHPPPGHAFPQGSLFADRAIPESDRVSVEWGGHSGIDAVRQLLKYSLREPANQRFVVVSESCIPLYPAWLLYAQLLTEKKSRINACTNPQNPQDEQLRMVSRFAQGMQTDTFNPTFWRKSSQFLSLIRPHAELVVRESAIDAIFRQECFIDMPQRYCLSDEHYISSMLAAHGLDASTDCMGTLVNAWWEGNFAHPKTWQPAEVSGQLLPKLRLQSAEDCHSWRCEHMAGEDDVDYGQCEAGRVLSTIDSVLEEAGVIESVPDAGTSRRLRQLTVSHSPFLSGPAHVVKTADIHKEEDLSDANSNMLQDRIVRLLMHRYWPLGYQCPLLARKFEPTALPQVEQMASSYMPWK